MTIFYLKCELWSFDNNIYNELYIECKNGLVIKENGATFIYNDLRQCVE